MFHEAATPSPSRDLPAHHVATITEKRRNHSRARTGMARHGPCSHYGQPMTAARDAVRFPAAPKVRSPRRPHMGASSRITGHGSGGRERVHSLTLVMLSSHCASRTNSASGTHSSGMVVEAMTRPARFSLSCSACSIVVIVVSRFVRRVAVTLCQVPQSKRSPARSFPSSPICQAQPCPWRPV